MRRILLDTSAYAAFMRAHPDVKRAVQQAEEMIWVGATAMQYGLQILTTDAHYRKVTQVLLDCFD